ncbi:MAG TPA: hypothetical protein EYP85_11675 [Armatimonadetes bacterium]|nr:hypothetical protein [Armatimonadota bacterium]
MPRGRWLRGPDSGQNGASGSSKPQVLLHWRVHRAAEEPGKAVLALGFIALAAGAAQVGFRQPWLTVAGTLLLLGAVADFLWPVTYLLTEEGAEMRSLVSHRVIRWPEVRRCYLDPEGIKLSPLAQPSRWEPFRGVYLNCPHNREVVAAIVRERATERLREE